MMAGKGSTTSASLGILISGRGSNLQSLIDAQVAGELPARIAVVISNKPGAPGLDRARAAGIAALTISHRDYPDRDAFDAAVALALKARGVTLVCLAGFMRRIGRPLLEAFPEAILNIHPSLLPSFPGTHAQAQALAHGVKVSGATVHLVDGDLDAGPIVAQATVPVKDDDTEESLATRILVEEHRLYPLAVRIVLAGGWTIDGRRFLRDHSVSA
jgi:phosphoribosylglycinamide formyltransferase 1